jgi:hypothetical protein
MKKQLHDRINRIINTPAFEETLGAEGICLFDFQAEWSEHASFEALPEAFKKAILAGEAELAGDKLACVA